MSRIERQSVAAQWSKAVLICAKCSKKVRGGFGRKGTTSLAKMLRPDGKGRKAPYGVLEVKCLKLCPKNAVTVVDSARPNEWQLIRPGTPIEDVIARLGLRAPLPER